MRLPAALALALTALALIGCESSQERSAQLEKVAHRKRLAQSKQELRVTSPSRSLKAATAAVVTSSEGSAVVVTVRNSGGAQREAPLEFSVAQSGGAAVTNTGPGLARSLVSVPYVPAHGTAVWVDDQVTLAGRPGAVTAKLGDGRRTTANPPQIALGPHHSEQEGSGEAITGMVTNDSAVEQKELVVYAVASRGSKVLAAGRAVIAALGAHSSASYTVFLLGGSAKGARLTLSAPPTTFG